MYLKSLKLTDFAGVGHAELPDLEPGLNVVVGDNEAGKSTLLLALRAALFQKHRASGEAVKALAPYGENARPRVELDFTIGDIDYRLEKAFLQRQHAELTEGGRTLSGDEVEERLADLFGFSHPGRGEPKLAEHQGAFGLLWVEQGRSAEGLDLGAGRDAVTASLEGEVGQILGGERGRSLIARAKTLQDRFYTETLRVSGKSPLAAAEAELDGLRADLEMRRAAARQLDAKLERLDSRRGALRRLRRDRAEEVAEAELARAERVVSQMAELKREIADAGRDTAFALSRRDAAAERLQRRDRAGEDLKAARAAVEPARAEVADLKARQEAAKQALEAARRRRDTAQGSMERAEEAERLRQALGERRRLDGQIAGLHKRIATADALADQIRQLQKPSGDPSVDRQSLSRLEEAERRCNEAAIKLSVAVPTLRFDPQEGRCVRDEGGEAIDAGEALPLARSMRLHLEGFGAIEITLGHSAEALAAESEEARRDLDGALARLGLGSVDAARKALAASEQRKSEIVALGKQRDAVLPDGIDAARRECAADCEKRDELSRLIGGGETGGDALESETADAERSKALVKEAREETNAARADVETRNQTVVDAVRALAEAEADLRRSEGEAERRQGELAEAEAVRGRAALAEDLAANEVERSAKAAVLDDLTRKLAAADPETAERTLAAKTRALAIVRDDMAKLRGEILTLEAELRIEGATALGEETARLEGEIGALEKRVERLRLEAQASRLLYSTLVEAQREAREHWLDPIRQEVAPYLRLIHPGTDIELDDATLEIRSFHRKGIAEDFRRLSTGAREQVAVVTRLAFAQVLRKGGHPAAVILDDALVNTDEKRLERMHTVLRKAAEDLQIIVLTCREQDFRGLGAPIFRL